MLDPFFKSPGKFIAVLIILALGVTGWGIFLALRPSSTNQAASTSPSPLSFPSQPEEAISALGRLEPGGEVFCVAASSSSGGFSSVIRKWMVKEGDRVKQNQVIAVMDTYDRLYTSALQAQAQVQEAQVRVAQAKTGAKPAEIQAQQAEAARWEAERANALAEYQRYERLYKEGAISKSELDSRFLTLQTTTRQIEQAISKANSLAQVRPVDVQQAEAQLQVAIANLQRAKAELETAAVRSPITGQILKIRVKEGEQIGTLGSTNSQECNGVAELGKTDQMYAVAEVDETSISRVRPGQRASVTSLSQAFPGSLSGTVERVGLQIRRNDVLNTDPVADTDTRVVEVRVRLDDSRPVARLTNARVSVKIAP
ncbi:MAG: HlyD family efflux transporter periplasmic adaptor subunit [Leptolyngbyaceae cyanobacterium HOT.MB2.61]|nr:HlyD family efflux transporter periplasmic adaptor subunit [Leptolyngbyaceae cyanobacterium HOT.MB2.61]